MSSIVESLKHKLAEMGEKKNNKNLKGTRLVTVFFCAWSVDVTVVANLRQ